LGEWHLGSAAPEETREIGRALGKALQEPALIRLSGELGAGKTCFVQGLARGLGVAEEEAVTSPTFTLMNHYHGRLDLYHFDLYRLAHADELIEMGMDEFLPGRGVAVVEWAERLSAGEMATLSIHFEHAGEDHRRLTFTSEDGSGERLLEQLRRSWQQRRGGE
jgi:tRNA threonylcarbamoyladenosine biosynthesis protein TsaE